MRKLYLFVTQQTDDFPRKATTRLAGRALHEEDDHGLVHEPA